MPAETATAETSTASESVTNRVRSVTDRAPRVSVRRDADAPILEVDPMLKQQLTSIPSNSVPDIADTIERGLSEERRLKGLLAPLDNAPSLRFGGRKRPWKRR
ncbi:hypothetical protein ACFQJD_00240 [Haloplanus sp. GCM10025708]|uniref:hypothetical protein n=1 Tax=Haloplanus sp. GCM10025708 TaxID=3252679 RepID=UPI00360DBF55